MTRIPLRICIPVAIVAAIAFTLRDRHVLSARPIPRLERTTPEN